MRSRFAPMRALVNSRETGQVLVLFAVFMIILLVLAGSAYDYASIVVDDARLQNAVDAAALAGSDTLSRNAALPGQTSIAIAQSTVTAYLQANSVATATPGTNITITFPTSTPISGVPTPASPIYENINLSVSRDHPTFFWPLVGINKVSMAGQGGAHAARGMVDVMLSLDTTWSQVQTGTLPSIQAATTAFINQMNPTTSDPRGPKVGIARFGGIMCDYDPSGSGSYNQGCVDDEAVLTPLTQDKPTLLAVANGPSSSPCPAGAAANGGCPISHLYYTAANWSGCPGSCSPAVRSSGTTGGFLSPWWPAATGTKLPNAFSVVGVSPTSPYPFLPSYAWSTANGGRNDVPVGTGNARKVMVFMTDGKDEMWPSPGPGAPESPATYDTQVQAMANALKTGPDNVEVFVVAYFCTPYSPGATGTPAKWCQSQLADTPAPHPCPGALYPPTGWTPSTIDNILNAVSSSTPGTCDHYYPLGKSENLLPQLFAALAGRISRGQLTS